MFNNLQEKNLYKNFTREHRDRVAFTGFPSHITGHMGAYQGSIQLNV